MARATWCRASEEAGFVALLVLGALLPFERTEPLLHVGPLAITDVELVLYVVVALWGAGRMLGGRIRWTPVHGAVLAWAAALALSAALAPSGRPAAVKFALRGAGGCALFFATVDGVATAGRAARVMLALAAGGVASAGAALAEAWIPGAAQVLAAFKSSAWQWEGVLRASGTLQYPTIAAMYWESALPLLLALAAAGSGRSGSRRSTWIAATSGLVLLQAIVLTASRAGIAVAALVLGALAAVGGFGGAAVRGSAVAGLAALAVFVAGHRVVWPRVLERGETGSGQAWYRAECRPALSSLALAAGEARTLDLAVGNTGSQRWPAADALAIRLGHEWREAEGTLVSEGPLASLSRDVEPGEEIRLAIGVRAPSRPGRYVLRWQLVSQGATWAGDPGGEVAVSVTGSAPEPEPARARPIQRQPRRLELWRAGLLLWREHPFTGVGPDNFRHLYAAYLGPRRLDDRVHANSLYVETLADLGLVGAAALAALIVQLGRASWKGWQASSGAEARVLSLGLSAGLGAFFVHGALDHFLGFTPTYGLFWILVGLAAARSRE